MRRIRTSKTYSVIDVPRIIARHSSRFRRPSFVSLLSEQKRVGIYPGARWIHEIRRKIR